MRCSRNRARMGEEASGLSEEPEGGQGSWKSRGAQDLSSSHRELWEGTEPRGEVEAEERTAQGTRSAAPSPPLPKAAPALSPCCRDFPDGHIRALAMSRPWMYVSA